MGLYDAVLIKDNHLAWLAGAGGTRRGSVAPFVGAGDGTGGGGD